MDPDGLPSSLAANGVYNFSPLLDWPVQYQWWCHRPRCRMTWFTAVTVAGLTQYIDTLWYCELNLQLFTACLSLLQSPTSVTSPEKNAVNKADAVTPNSIKGLWHYRSYATTDYCYLW